MSRSRKGSKPPGYEFWSPRPQSGGKGAESKRICHKQERAASRRVVFKELKELDAIA